MTTQQNWFPTLVSALQSEDLLDLWLKRFPFGEQAVSYGETFCITLDDGSRYGRVVSIYRSDTTGNYERPLHYQC